MHSIRPLRLFLFAVLGVVVLVALEHVGTAQSSAPRNLRIVTNTASIGMIAPSDFTYLGMMKIPTQLSYASGALAGKTVGNQVSFFMDAGHWVYEFPYVGESLDVASAPRAPLTKEWGDIYGGKKISWDYATGAVRNTGATWGTHGLVYHNDRLYWSYLDFYNSAYGATDHCVGFSDLSSGKAVPYGPFRFANSNVKVICGMLLNLPNGQLGMGGSMGSISRNTDNSWGPAISMTPFMTPSTPGGYNSPQLAVQSHLSFSLGDRSPRVGDYKSDTSNPYNPDIEPVGGNGYWTQRDRMTSIAWILTSGGKRGVLFMGGLATGQVWYGHYDSGPNGARNPCRSSTRGENAEGFRPEWRVYDPDRFGSASGRQPVVTFNPLNATNGAKFDYIACEQYVHAAYFDRASSKLFVLGGYDPTYGSMPMIHVWHIKP